MGALGWTRSAPARRSAVLALPTGGYAGARVSRLEWDWLADLVSADQQMRGSLRDLRKRCRERFRNDPLARAFGTLSEVNVLGASGVGFQSRADVADEINDRIEDAWADFCRSGNCTVDGMLSFADVERLAVLGEAVEGEFLCVMRRSGEYGLQLQVYDMDQLDSNYDTSCTPLAGNVVRMGIEQEVLTGRPVAYWLYEQHPSEAMGTLQRIPAEQVIHVARRNRPRQTRGEPPMAPVLLLMKMLDGFREAEIVAARTAASKAVVYEQTAEGMGADPTEGGSIPDELSPGMNQLLPIGVSAKMLDPTHPNINFGDFASAISMSIATGLGVSYAALTGDQSKANYGSQRGALIQERDQWKLWQARLIDQLHRKVFRAWLQSAVAVGKLPLAGDWRKYLADEWQPRVWGWIDPAKDLEAKERELMLGLTTRTQLAAELGRNFDENLEQLAEEQADALAAGVNVNGVGSTAQFAASAAAPGDAALNEVEATQGK